MIDLTNDHYYRTSLGNVALESHYNDVVIAGVRLSTEDWLAETEGAAAPVIHQSVDDPSSIPSLSMEDEFASLMFKYRALRMFLHPIA